MRSLFAGRAEDPECRQKQKTVNGSDKCFKAFWQANQRSTTVSRLGARHVQPQSQGTDASSDSSSSSSSDSRIAQGESVKMFQVLPVPVQKKPKLSCFLGHLPTLEACASAISCNFLKFHHVSLRLTHPSFCARKQALPPEHKFYGHLEAKPFQGYPV